MLQNLSSAAVVIGTLKVNYACKVIRLRPFGGEEEGGRTESRNRRNVLKISRE